MCPLKKADIAAINILLSNTQAHIVSAEEVTGAAIFKSAAKNLRSKIESAGFVRKITKDNKGEASGHNQYWLEDYSIFLYLKWSDDQAFTLYFGEGDDYEFVTPNHWCNA